MGYELTWHIPNDHPMGPMIIPWVRKVGGACVAGSGEGPGNLAQWGFLMGILHKYMYVM